MLKRNVVVLITGILLGTQVGMATAEDSVIPPSGYQLREKILSTQSTYADEHGAARQEAQSAADAVPPSGYQLREKNLSVTSTYADTHGAAQQILSND